MTSQTDNPPAAAPPGDGDQGAGHDHDAPTMDDVRKVVDDALEPIKSMLAKITGGGAPAADKKTGEAAPAGDPADIDSMITRAIDAVLGDRDKKAAADAHDEEHKKLREAAAERTPIDRPRRSRWLGKIYDD